MRRGSIWQGALISSDLTNKMTPMDIASPWGSTLNLLRGTTHAVVNGSCPSLS